MGDQPFYGKLLVTFALMGGALWTVLGWRKEQSPPPSPSADAQVARPSPQERSPFGVLLNWLEQRLVAAAHGFWSWYYRRGIETEGGRMFYDGMLKVIHEREDAEATQPKVAAFLEIPATATWCEGLKFDRPDLILPWTATTEEFERDFSRGDDHHAVEVDFLGCNFRSARAKYTDTYMWPHRGQTLASISLTGPFRPRAEILPEYDFCAEKLLEVLGAPSMEEEVEFFLWPKHTKRCWKTPFLRITHCITDLRDSDPVNWLLIEREHSKAYFEKFPNYSGA